MGFSKEEQSLFREIKKDFNNLNIEKYKADIREYAYVNNQYSNLINSIELGNVNDILEFGKAIYEGVASISEEVLKYLRINNRDGINEALKSLTKLMDSFDIDDFTENKKSFIDKLFKKEKNIEFLKKKYSNLALNLENFYRELKYEESAILDSNKRLEAMFLHNMRFYEELEQYLYAAENLKTDILNKRNNTNLIEIEKIKYDLSLEAIEKRIEDFNISQIIAMETIIMINEIEKGNIEILEKIQNSFLIALPIFKNNLAQIIMLKKEELRNKSIEAINKKVSQVKALEGKSNLKDLRKDELERSVNEIRVAIDESKLIGEKNNYNKRKSDLSKILAKAKK